MSEADQEMDTTTLEAEAARTERQEMASFAAEIAEALESQALFGERPTGGVVRQWHPELRRKAQDVARYLKERAE